MIRLTAEGFSSPIVLSLPLKPPQVMVSIFMFLKEELAIVPVVTANRIMLEVHRILRRLKMLGIILP